MNNLSVQALIRNFPSYVYGPYMIKINSSSSDQKWYCLISFNVFEISLWLLYQFEQKLENVEHPLTKINISKTKLKMSFPIQ